MAGRAGTWWQTSRQHVWLELERNARFKQAGSHVSGRSQGGQWQQATAEAAEGAHLIKAGLIEHPASPFHQQLVVQLCPLAGAIKGGCVNRIIGGRGRCWVLPRIAATAAKRPLASQAAAAPRPPNCAASQEQYVEKQGKHHLPDSRQSVGVSWVSGYLLGSAGTCRAFNSAAARRRRQWRLRTRGRRRVERGNTSLPISWSSKALNAVPLGSQVLALLRAGRET